MSGFQYKLLSGAIAVMLLASILYVGREVAVYVTAGSVDAEKERLCVVIDAGHGGDDPGKVGINGANEKDLNLQIAEQLKVFLEANDVEVIMTRETDAGLYDPDASNKKVQDMKRRIALIEEVMPVLTVSIHQNSYPEEYVHGAQVFYYTGSTQGQMLAEAIQNQMVKRVDPENRRQVKANDSYYLLKKTGVPIVIVECGFLSNSAEAEKLCTPEYQQRVAWAIHMGILQYMNAVDGIRIKRFPHTVPVNSMWERFTQKPIQWRYLWYWGLHGRRQSGSERPHSHCPPESGIFQIIPDFLHRWSRGGRFFRTL